MRDIKIAGFLLWAFIAGRFAEIREVSRMIDDLQISEQWVYFIGDPARRVVKIGISNNVARRLLQVQTSYPYQLSVLCVLPGSEEMERRLHNAFAPLRLNGEWFRLDYRLKTYIALASAEMAARAKEPELI